MSDSGGVGVAWEATVVSDTYYVNIESYDIGMLQNTVEAWRGFLEKVEREGQEPSEEKLDAFVEEQPRMERVRVLRQSDGYSLLDVY